MRRLFAAALLLLFSCQSSGIAIAMPTVKAFAARPLMAELQFQLSQQVATLRSSRLGAFLTGRARQYEATNAPAPTFPHNVLELFTRADLLQHRPLLRAVFPAGAVRGKPVANLHRFQLPPRQSTSGIAPESKSAHASFARHSSLSTATVAATPPPNVTGINPFWEYQTGPIPGAGQWISNVATGNLIVQDVDVDVPERGVGLTFQRTYNSLSGHTYTNDDGSVQSNYGDGWTNTFDAHLAFYNNAQTLSVYDADGARYDYSCPSTTNGQCNWSPPPGLQGTSLSSSDSGCSYWWVKKDGTGYWFWSPTYAPSCNSSGYTSYNGRLIYIQGRNHNNYVQLCYYWDGSTSGTVCNAGNPSNALINHIVVSHSDGHAMTLQFADFTNTGGMQRRLLAEITRPDGQVLHYYYDYNTSANTVSSAVTLTDVCIPGNGSITDNSPNASMVCGDTAHIHHRYYANNGHLLYWADSPRWATSWGGQGNYVSFQYVPGAGYVSQVQDDGIMNFTPADGTGAALQSGPSTSSYAWHTSTFTWNSGETQLSDTDGHATNWFYDGSGRVTQTQEWTGAPNNSWLNTFASWDANNNLTETIDPRNNATDYGYDAKGNVIWIQEPQVTTYEGTGRPLARFFYDGNNNLVASCDPQYIWTSGAAACNTATSGVAYYTWTTNANEPYGYLTETYAPNGYHTIISYNQANEGGGDYGLPTQVAGAACISPQFDGTQRCPQLSITYDPLGNITSYNNGVGSYSFAYSNNGLNLLDTAIDPDNVATCIWYYQNGQVSARETPAERVATNASSQCNALANPDSTAQTFSYDADGDEIAETHHFNNAATTTNKWYDGSDRLVEVQLPHDPNDIFSSWLTRYIFDLSSSSTSSYHGNLMSVQRYIPNESVQTGTSVTAGYAWVNVKQWTYDTLDRVLQRSYFSPGASAMSSDTWTYDSRGAGLLGSFSNAAGDAVTYSYDNLGEVTRRDFSSSNSLFTGSLPSEELAYDADGRLHSYNNDETGMSFTTYDADGNIASYSEPNGAASWSRPSTLGTINPISLVKTYNFSYYADDLMSQLYETDGNYTQQYNYRTDGLLESQQSSATWTYSNTTYSANYGWNQSFTNAGRLNYKSDTITDPCPSTGCTRHTMSYCNSGCTQGPALNVGYDLYGRINNWAIPEGTYNGFQYDDEGETTQFNAGPQQWTLGYSTRGELLKQGPSLSNPSWQAQSADGFLYTQNQICWTNRYGMDYCQVPTLGFDPRNGGIVSSQRPGNAVLVTYSFNYDPAGRRSGRGYDGLNRLYYGGTYATYGQGPGTIPAAGYYGTNHTALGQPILHSNSGTVDDVKLGMNSDIIPGGSFNGLTVYDRDPWGFIAAARNTTGNSALTIPDMFSEGSALAQPVSATAGFTATNTPRGSLYPFRTDGWSDGNFAFRGVRTYDADTQQWSTPDVYQGSAGDPMSGMGYSYANNNPAMFADPSGFCGSAWMDYGAQGTGPVSTNWVPCEWIDGFNNCIGGCFGPSGSEYVPGVGMPIMVPWKKIIGNPNVFIQGCAGAGIGGCVLVDGCENAYGSGGLSGSKKDLINLLRSSKFPTLGASAASGYAFPFPGNNAQKIYNGPSFSSSTGAEGAIPGVGFSVNSSGFLLFVQIGGKLPTAGGSVATPIHKGSCGGNP